MSVLSREKLKPFGAGVITGSVMTLYAFLPLAVLILVPVVIVLYAAMRFLQE